MCLDRSAVNAQVIIVCICIQFLKNTKKGSIITPLAKTAVNGCGPNRAGISAQAVPLLASQNMALGIIRSSFGGSASFCSRDQILAPVPLGIGQFVSSRCHRIASMPFLLFYCFSGFCAIYI